MPQSPESSWFDRSLTRRRFLAGAGALAAWGLMPLGRAGWAFAQGGAPTRRLVVVMLRGAVDGLNVVVPHGDPTYYDYRPRIAIPRPKDPQGAIDLDGHFGLHPALASLMPLWNKGQLAFVHASGSPDPSRSHFDAQAYMESGTPGDKHTPDGWMNRLLARLPGPHGPTEALSFGPTLPRIFSGRVPVANVPLGRAATQPMALDRPAIEAAFDRLYDGKDALSAAYAEGKMARKELLADLVAADKERMMADNGAPSPVGFSQDTTHLAALISRDPSVRLAFLALGGWDTHVYEGSSTGQLAGHLRPLAEGLTTLAAQLGDQWRDTLVVVMSEFGRTAHENGDGGTDHGHGNAMWVLGGAIRGKQVYGPWPGLAPGQLYQGRDLAITTDFRSVLEAALAQHLGLDGGTIAQVLPGAPPSPGYLANLSLG